MDELRFDGRVAVVTGSGRGLGRVHALDLAARGARVVVADLGGALEGGGRSSEPADAVVREIEAAGGEAIAVVASVAEEAEATSIVEAALDTWGQIDILLNNAGIADHGLFEDRTVEQFQRMIDVHFLGTLYTVRAAWPHMMKAGGGHIVNTCSEFTLGINRKVTTYGAAKGGVFGLTLSLAAEAPDHGIFVNGYVPQAATRLSAPDVMAHVFDRPAELFEKVMVGLTPELASPPAVYLAHDSCTLNGIILVSGAGRVSRLAFAQSAGFSNQALSAELVAEHIDEIVDMTDPEIKVVGSAEKRESIEKGKP